MVRAGKQSLAVQLPRVCARMIQSGLGFPLRQQTLRRFGVAAYATPIVKIARCDSNTRRSIAHHRLCFVPRIIVSSGALRRPKFVLMAIEPIANLERVADAVFIDAPIVCLHLRPECALAAPLDIHVPECVKHERDANRVFGMPRFKRTIFCSIVCRAETIPIFDQ